jgi:hypothetical protein
VKPSSDTPSKQILEAIAAAVRRAGGDHDDFLDLVAVWKRVARRSSERADLIAREAKELAKGAQ